MSRRDEFAYACALALREADEPLHSGRVYEMLSWQIAPGGRTRVPGVPKRPIGLTKAATRGACKRGVELGLLEHVDGPAGGKWRAIQ